MIVIRTKGNHKQGMGDITGSLALADELARLEKAPLLAVDNDMEAVEAVRASGHGLAAFSGWDDETAWWQKNSGQIEAAVFNRLNSDAKQVGLIKNTLKCPVATIDDVGPAAALADIRFNPLYHYPDSMTGPEHIPLNKVFQEAHGVEKKYGEKVERFLLTLGGSDTWGFTPKMVEFLAPVSESLGTTTVITGSAFRHQTELEKALKEWKGKIEVLKRIPAEEMARRMLEADLALCSGGMTVFEMACCGTAAAVLSNEPWELETAGALEKLGYGASLGFGEDVGGKRVLETVTEFANSRALREKHGVRGRGLVDGKGAARMAAKIICKISGDKG